MSSNHIFLCVIKISEWMLYCFQTHYCAEENGKSIHNDFTYLFKCILDLVL